MDTLATIAAALDAERAGDLDDAERRYRAALADPAAPALASSRLGLLLLRRGHAAEAVVHLAAAAAARPDNAADRVNLAGALLTAGRFDEARDMAISALRLAPNLAPAHAALAAACLAAGDAHGALAAADTALALSPSHAEAWFTCGTALAALGDAEGSVRALETALELAPGHARARLNLGNVLASLDRPEEAQAALRAAIAADPALPEAHASLGHLLAAMGRPDEAIAACDAAIALRPDFAQAYWNRSFAHLLAGDFARGWADYEWRRRHPRFAGDFSRSAAPAWPGEDLGGRTLLVEAEQGLGDTIQFARFVPALRARGGRVVLAVAPALRRLLASLAETADRESPPPHDLRVDQLSLPLLMATTLDTIPPAPYLVADSAAVQQWHLALPRRPRVGLVWAGNPSHSNDRRRSLPLGALHALLRDPRLGHIQFIALQRGPREGEYDLPAPLPPTGDFVDTAALVAALDHVVSIDSSVAHLAGALGVAVSLLLPAAPDWRWLLDRNDSPWYAGHRLYRQSRPGDWAPAIAAIARDLA
ncbi:MAG: tetratricopeptide repeat protein, partial [Rhodospirillales bacterium]|nr:tetratricopeptide repeat protein [Rhodospirillales bacterium]